MRASSVAALVRIGADDPQIGIADALSDDLVEIVRRRSAKESDLKGQGVAYALARTVATVLLRLGFSEIAFDAWAAAAREDMVTRIEDARARAAEPKH